MRIARGLLTVVSAFLVTVVGTGALGATLTPIGALTPAGDGGVAESKVYALSPDGAWAVGASNGANSTNTATISQAVVWSSSSGLVQLPNAADGATSARGVVVKSSGDLGIAGYAYNAPTTLDYRMASYTVSPSDLTGGAWVISPGTSNLTVGTYNAARTYGSSGDWSIAGQRSNGARAIQSYVVGNTYSDSGVVTGYRMVYNVSSRVPVGSGRGAAAGYQMETATGLRRALFGITGSAAGATVIPGSAGYQSEALGMSPDTTSAAGSGVIVGHDQDTTADHFKHAFYYPQGAAAMLLLSELAGDNQSEAIDVRIVGGSTIIGGYSSDGITEEAVIWRNGAPSSLASMLTGAGVDVSAWSSLSRITSMSDDGLTVAGWGVKDGITQGFVAVIPEPASLLLLTLAGLVLRRRR